jgi:hypothetical protein
MLFLEKIIINEDVHSKFMKNLQFSWELFIKFFIILKIFVNFDHFYIKAVCSTKI